MNIEHNSLELMYRKPFGAVEQNTDVRLRLSLGECGIPRHVRAVFEYDGKTEYRDMPYVFDFAGVCVYETVLKMPEKTGLVHYYFDVELNNGRVYYSAEEDGFGGIGRIYNQVPEKKYQITVFEHGYKTPDWWKNSVCYQIFPDRFANGKDGGEFLGDREDIIKRKWGEEPFYKAEQFGGKYLANDFFGGNLIGIEKKLPYLKELGISCIYLNPIFKAYSNHKYDTGDYKTIDPMFGTERDFIRLCQKAEKQGIRIILDGVFNHTGSDSLYFNKSGSYDSVGAYQSKQSPYYDWYRFSDYPDEYESWWGIDTLPQIEESSDAYQDFILRDSDAVVKKWIKNGAYGWRLDVVDELPDFFVEILRKEVKSEKPDAVIIGEVWEDASNKVAYGEQRRYFMGSELDSVMNYPLRNAMVDFALGNIDACMFDRRIMSLKENYPKEAFYASLNFLSTHDIPRILTILGGYVPENKDEMSNVRLDGTDREEAVKLLKCLTAMLALMPGVPTIFYGDEAGLEGYGDPFCRRCYPWGNEDYEIMDCYKKTIKLRNENESLRSGEFETVYKNGKCYAFIRYNKNSSFITAVNFGEETVIRIDAARFGLHCLNGVMHVEEYHSDDGIYYIHMPEKSVKIFKN